MCDTVVALPNSTFDRSLIFGKNSDREPNEPQIVVRVPRRTYEKRTNLKCTYIEIPQIEETYEMILVKPSWIWGAEMGVNEKGLIIGNEAVFTKVKTGKKALLGMDILRLALERSGTAKEAVECMTNIIEKYGQGGKAGYTSNLSYHNSFIAADFNEAYVLETAGNHWVVTKVKDIYSISNALTIGRDFENCSKDAVTYAIQKGWCKDKKTFNFRESYGSKLHLIATQGDIRRSITTNELMKQSESISIGSVMSTLRNHGAEEKVKNFQAGSMRSVCMHGGGIISSQTTGSLIVRLKDNDIQLWVTGSSLPCISLFKPMWFTKDYFNFYLLEDSDKAVEKWTGIERFHRMVLSGEVNDIGGFITKRNEVENKLMKMAQGAVTEEDRVETMKFAYNAEKEMINEMITKNSRGDKMNSRNNFRGNLYYKHYWKKQNRIM